LAARVGVKEAAKQYGVSVVMIYRDCQDAEISPRHGKKITSIESMLLVLKCLQRGMSRADAAREAGVGYDTSKRVESTAKEIGLL
jgi:transposase